MSSNRRQTTKGSELSSARPRPQRPAADSEDPGTFSRAKAVGCELGAPLGTQEPQWLGSVRVRGRRVLAEAVDLLPI